MADLFVYPPGEHSQAHANLRGGQSCSGGILHRVGEVSYEKSQFFVVGLHLSGGGAQHRIPKEADGSDCHDDSCPVMCCLTVYVSSDLHRIHAHFDTARTSMRAANCLGIMQGAGKSHAFSSGDGQ